MQYMGEVQKVILTGEITVDQLQGNLCGLAVAALRSVGMSRRPQLWSYNSARASKYKEAVIDDWLQMPFH
jgi:hypothetical protein